MDDDAEILDACVEILETYRVMTEEKQVTSRGPEATAHTRHATLDGHLLIVPAHAATLHFAPTTTHC
jgi:hypothetical protein